MVRDLVLVLVLKLVLPLLLMLVVLLLVAPVIGKKGRKKKMKKKRKNEKEQCQWTLHHSTAVLESDLRVGGDCILSSITTTAATGLTFNGGHRREKSVIFNLFRRMVGHAETAGNERK